MTQEDMLKECRLDAKAFRENNTYDSDGNPIRLIAVADRLDTYANWIAATDAENQRLGAEVDALREALGTAITLMSGHASKIGPMHSWWDVILDMRAALTRKAPQ